MHKRIWILLLFVLIGFLKAFGQDSLSSNENTDTTRLRILLAGDMMGHVPLFQSCLMDDGTYDYSPIFTDVKPYISKYDLAIVNLEVTLAGKPYSGYPQFSSPDAVAKGLKDAGFNVLINANNHAVDKGKAGVERTIRVMDSLEFIRTGTFLSPEDKQNHYPLFLEKNHIKIAILNYTYGTNGNTLKGPDLINYIDTAEIRKDIQKCHESQTDFILVTFHWGIEYERIPSDNQRKIAEFVRLLGADAIIGSHPHVVQTIENLPSFHYLGSNVPIVYSMGNFVSNQRERYKDGGIMVELDVIKVHHVVRTSCYYMPVWVYRGVYNEKTVYRLFVPEKLDKEAEFYNLDDKEKQKAQEFFDDTKEHLFNIPLIQ